MDAFFFLIISLIQFLYLQMFMNAANGAHSVLLKEPWMTPWNLPLYSTDPPESPCERDAL